MTEWVQPSLLDLLDSKPDPAPTAARHTPGRYEPFRITSLSFCWRCHKWVDNEFPGTYQYLGRDALTRYQPGESKKLHDLECPFMNGGHAPISVEHTELGNAFVACLCGGKFGQAAFEEHLLTAPITGAFLLEEK